MIVFSDSFPKKIKTRNCIVLGFVLKAKKRKEKKSKTVCLLF